MNEDRDTQPGDTLPRLVDIKAHLSPTALEMLSVLTAMFQRKGLPAQVAAHHAENAVLELAFLMGGRVLYLPREQKLKRVLRDIKITDQLGKRTASELAIEHEVAVQTIYEIAKQQRRLRRSGDVTPAHR